MKHSSPPVSQQVSDDYKLLLTPPFSAMSKITDNLFLTGVGGMTRTNFTKNHIDFVVNITTDAPFWQDTESMRIPLEDDAAANVLAHLDFAVDKIHEVITKRNAHVLVHCVAGVSRSATIVIGYLMKIRRLDLKTAFNYCFNLRPVIRPNNGFMIQLINYEQQLFGRPSTVQMVDVDVDGILVSVPNFFLDEHPKLVLLEVLRARDLLSQSQPGPQQQQPTSVVVHQQGHQVNHLQATKQSQPSHTQIQPQAQPPNHKHQNLSPSLQQQQQHHHHHHQHHHSQRTLAKSDLGSGTKSAAPLAIKSATLPATKSATSRSMAVKSTTRAKSPTPESPSTQSKDGP